MASRFASSKSNGEHIDLDTFLFEGCPTLCRWGRWGRWGNGWRRDLDIRPKQRQQRNRNHPISSITTQLQMAGKWKGFTGVIPRFTGAHFAWEFPPTRGLQIGSSPEGARQAQGGLSAKIGWFGTGGTEGLSAKTAGEVAIWLRLAKMQLLKRGTSDTSEWSTRHSAVWYSESYVL